MGKLNKYANIYDREGNLVRKVDDKTGKLMDYTVEELEELVDKLANDRDENGNINNPTALNNANSVLMQYYSTNKGRNRLAQLLKDLNAKKEQKTSEEQAKEALENLRAELEENGVEENPNEIVSKVESNLDEEYVEYEQIA